MIQMRVRILPGWLPTKSEGIGCRNAFPILLGHVGPSDVIKIWFPMVDREPTLEVQVTKETVLITTKWRVWRVSR